MKHLYLVLGLAAALAPAALAQSNPFEGRWDLTVTTSRDTYPDWIEIKEAGGHLSALIQPRSGSAHPATDVKRQGSHLTLTQSAATEKGPAVTWDLAIESDHLTGTSKRGDTVQGQLAGVRAPALKRPMPKAWTAPEPIFNGKDLTGWEPIGNAQNSKWVARNGELVNDNPEVEGQRGPGAANIKTTRKFDDFKLHIEVNCPEHGNSGIYLRGRYEIQVGTEGGTTPSHEMGAIYGYRAPDGNLPNGLGKWSTFDITLVGRTVTVIRDGVKIHDNVEIPGITGGVLDVNEGEPGPFYLQGDHQGVIQFRNITVSVPK